MTEILAGPGSIFPQNKKVSGLPPMPKPRAGSVQQLRSLNKPAREREVQRITHENEQLLKRLQQAPATYNIFDWES
jgi:hypothetical protein